MNNYIRLVRYILKYWPKAALNISFNIISVFFSLFSLAMAIPFLGILFKSQPMVTETVPFEFKYEAFTHNFNYFLSQVIVLYGESRALVLVCVIVVIMTFFKTFFNYFASFFMAPIMNGVARDIQKSMYEKLLSLPIGYFSNERKGDIMSRMSSDIAEIKFSIMSSLDIIFRDPITILIYLTSLIIISPGLTVFVGVALPVTIFIIGRIGKSLKRNSTKGQEAQGDMLSLLEESLGGLKIIKAFNAESKLSRRFKEINDRIFFIMNKIMRRRSLSTPLSEMMGTIVIVSIMLYGGALVLNHESSLTSQEFITYLIIFSQIITPAKSFSTAYYNIQKGLASFERVLEVLDHDVRIKDSEKAKSYNEFANAIELKGVSFKYANEFVLKNVNLVIKKGTTVALVGQSGSGKSTLADLIPRFHDISVGEITFDGISIKDIRMRDLRKLMGIVTQEPILFNDTIANNITLGVDQYTQESLLQAARVAHAYEFIGQIPEGFEYRIGDRGNKLSGGQRQRLSIARAVLKNPPILILDEATSSLDTESERFVQDALDNLMKNRTTLVIAHRLSTIKNADEICVLNQGEIVERGTHEQLIERNGHYRKLYELQLL